MKGTLITRDNANHLYTYSFIGTNPHNPESATCYAGYRSDADKSRGEPINGVGCGILVGLREKAEGLAYVSLRAGGFFWDQLVWTPRQAPKNALYHFEDITVRLPAGTRLRFGVYAINDDGDTPEEQVALSHALFGVTQELNKLLYAYNRTVEETPHLNSYFFARPTFSHSGDNHCEITNGIIPANFPYIYTDKWTHLSLWGFYFLLDLLSEDATFRQALIEHAKQQDLSLARIQCILSIPEQQYRHGRLATI
jgi:hypothetical protein